MLLNIATLVFMTVVNGAFAEPANVYPSSYDYASFNPYSTPYSWPDTQTPTYNPYGYQTYYPSSYPSQPSQSGQPAYTYTSAYPSYPSYPTYASYPPYSQYPSYPYYHFYPTQPPSVNPEASPPAGPIVWPTGRPKTTPRPAVWPTGSPTRPPSIPVWPTKRASLEATAAPSWPTVKTEPKRPLKYLQWPTEKSALPPTTPTTERPEKLPKWPTGPPRTTGVASVTAKWPTGAPGIRRTTATSATVTGRTTTTAAQSSRPADTPTRYPKPTYSSRRTPGITTPMPRIPVSRTENTKRPKVNKGKKHRGERPRRPNSRRKPKNKRIQPKTKTTRIPTISPITTPIPYLPDEDVEIIEGIPKYVPFAKAPVPPLNWDDLEPRISPLDTGEPLATPNYNKTSLAPDVTPGITPTTYASTRCKKLCLDQRGRRFCCGQETGRCPPKPDSCYVPMSDPIPVHRSKGQCFVDTQCAENFKCCLDYCEEEYYCTRVQFVL